MILLETFMEKSFKKVIYGGQPLEYPKIMYRGEFWESCETLSSIMSPWNTIKHLWRRVLKKSWKLSRLESTCDTLKFWKREFLQSGIGLGYYKVEELVLQSGTIVTKWSLTMLKHKKSVRYFVRDCPEKISFALYFLENVVFEKKNRFVILSLF